MSNDEEWEHSCGKECPRGCICVTHRQGAYGVIPKILPNCPWHRGVHPVTKKVTP